MKKLTIKKIVEFRGKSDRSKKSFANSINLDKEKENVKTESGSGGDYWISCLSTLSTSYKLNDISLITVRRVLLEEKYEITDVRKTKNRHKRNIDILRKYENCSFTKWMPADELKFLRKPKNSVLLNIKGFQIQVSPHYVFTFQREGVNEVGAIWFIAKSGGFRKDDLGMFSDILYRYLKSNFSNNHIVNSRYCIAVDVFNNDDVNYFQLENKEVPKILDSTLNSIKALM